MNGEPTAEALARVLYEHERKSYPGRPTWDEGLVTGRMSGHRNAALGRARAILSSGLVASRTQVDAVAALAAEWEAAGVVSVYESAAELAQTLREALSAAAAEETA